MNHSKKAEARKISATTVLTYEQVLYLLGIFDVETIRWMADECAKYGMSDLRTSVFYDLLKQGEDWRSISTFMRRVEKCGFSHIMKECLELYGQVRRAFR